MDRNTVNYKTMHFHVKSSDAQTNLSIDLCWYRTPYWMLMWPSMP